MTISRLTFGHANSPQDKHNKHCSTLHTVFSFHENVYIQRRDLFQLTLADAHCFYYGSLETLDFFVSTACTAFTCAKNIGRSDINYCSLLLFSATLRETTGNAFQGYWRTIQQMASNQFQNYVLKLITPFLSFGKSYTFIELQIYRPLSAILSYRSFS